ncbi:uncharacterized protein LOC112904421 [Agrilus planipennis]|uniref:Uncharacterized protein LOC112904421 n=1 Tax=Agrilus planipennis TaxID=224129 RepID=A0A7F5R455_AGRPL|nr:uncharacterized protein LOC112904421 [Agrilus planipennis]
MVTCGVVWCKKDDHWIPLQLSSIKLHGNLTEAHWAAISDFLQKVANKHFILQENGFMELTEDQKRLLAQQINRSNLECSTNEVKSSKNVFGVINSGLINPETDSEEKAKSLSAQESYLLQILDGKTEIAGPKILECNNSGNECSPSTEFPESDNNSHLQKFTLKFESNFLSDPTKSLNGPEENNCDNRETVLENSNFFKSEHSDTTSNNNVNVIGRFTIESYSIDSVVDDSSNKRKNIPEENEKLCSNEKPLRKISGQSDEIVLRLLRKYSKYSRDALDQEILSAVDSFASEDDFNNPSTTIRITPEEKHYENCKSNFGDEYIENEKNEYLLQWLKQQNRSRGFLTVPDPSYNRRRHSLGSDRNYFDCYDSQHKAAERKEGRKSSLPLFADLDFNKRSGRRTGGIASTPNSRKSSVSYPVSDAGRFSNLDGRKSSVTSNSSSYESEETVGSSVTSHWQKIINKHLGGNKLEQKLKKQRETWAINKRKLSTDSDSNDLFLQPWYFRKIKRMEAEKKLLLPENDHGAFLIRDSESRHNDYSLSGMYVHH